jgi:biotin-(acetyl-CoA carboxylase) ligase
MDEYRENCFLLGSEISFSDGSREYHGIAADIGDGCELKLQVGGELLSFTHGEITKF